MRYFDGAISLTFSLCVGLKLENPCKDYNRAIYKKKNKLQVTQAAVYIRKIICTSAAYRRRELERSLAHGLFLVSHSNQGMLQALASILIPRAHDPSGRWQGSKLLM